ncbi:MAG: glycosyltransferase [Synergistaceae bacterium]|nr:glycosyltransferase [Synergistaceae bacterium]
MRVLFINVQCGRGSHGKIAAAQAEEYERQGHEVKIAYGRDDVPENYKKYAVRIGSTLGVYCHALLTRLTDRNGFFSRGATRRFLFWADEYNPDLLWLHNIHGYYINIEMLFTWIKSRPSMKVMWTLHDCWAFTGHCGFFTFAKCEKWRTHCEHCPQRHAYPASFVDNSFRNYDDKRRLFTGVKDMTLITPSQWLADLVSQSFLKEYPCEVRHNEIDRNIFRPSASDFRERYGLAGKKIVLGVANRWEPRKGLGDFVRLFEILNPEKFVIVLVGLKHDKLPDNIIHIDRTSNQKELAEIYTAADVFFNPTYEDNYPTVNLEAEACGTPVITYRTGGAPETIQREDSCVIDCGDVEAAKEAIEQICEGGARDD